MQDLSAINIEVERRKFQTWAMRVRVTNDFRRVAPNKFQDYTDLDTDWLWRAWIASAKEKRE